MRIHLFHFSFFIFLISCEEAKPKTNFENWYTQNSPENNINNCNTDKYESVFQSKTLKINGLAKSMSGDMTNQIAEIKVNNESLIWITACQLKIVDADSMTSGLEKETSLEFLCHSIVNYAQPEKLPWKILTIGSDKRIFTLSQGANSINFPEGFALPFSVPAKLSIGNQVLNLNDDQLQKKLKYKVSISYLKNKELCQKPKALYQQAVFVTKKVEGPEGGFYQKDSSYAHKTGDMDTAFAQCGISFDEGYSPYLDPYGRKFTGHWKVSTDSIEILKTNVTPLLNLKYNTRIHYIVVHVHPYAYSLELVDKTTGKSLFKAMVYNEELKIGIRKVDSYSSLEGIPVFVDHEYQLISTYLNPEGKTDITAMATMFLYLREGSNIEIN